MNPHGDRRRPPSGGQRDRVLEGVLSEHGGPPASAGGRRFALRQSVEPVPGADGALYLMRAGDPDLVVRAPEPADRALLDLLAAGPRSAPELAERLGLPAGAVADKLAALDGAGVLLAAAESPPLDAADAERYDRQLPYLAEFGDERALQRRLAGARVVVVGCGGLGSWALAALAAAGVRRLRLVDDDTVALSNLNRQVIYTPADLGAPKVQSAAAWLRTFDPLIAAEPLALRVDGRRTAARIAAGADALVLAADQPPYELARWINAACLPARIPFITGGQLPPLLRVGPLYRPGAGPCFACHERALRAESADYDGYVRYRRSAPARGATLGPASGMVGTQLAMEIVHLLAGIPPASDGAALLTDLRTGATRREPVARDPACAACQHLG